MIYISANLRHKIRMNKQDQYVLIFQDDVKIFHPPFLKYFVPFNEIFVPFHGDETPNSCLWQINFWQKIASSWIILSQTICLKCLILHLKSFKLFLRRLIFLWLFILKRPLFPIFHHLFGRFWTFHRLFSTLNSLFKFQNRLENQTKS